MARKFLAGFSPRFIHDWFLTIVICSLGISNQKQGRHLLSRILKYITIGSAAGLFLTNIVFAVCDIVSVDTESDILDGIVSVCTVCYFCILGIYSRRLAKQKINRLFITTKAQESLELSGKSIAILLIMIISILALNCSMIDSLSPDLRKEISLDDSSKMNSSNPCVPVHLPTAVCQAYWVCQSIFSTFFLFWNFLVAMVLVSVSRIQVKNIQRFLGELKEDALALDRYYNRSYHEDQENYTDYIWMDGKTITEAYTQNVNKEEDSINTIDKIIKQNNYRHMPEEELHENNRMSEQEILHKYWKICMSVRMVSISLETWTSSVIACITAWSAVRLVYWLSHDPSLYGVCMFILPLLLLPLLSSAYADVNHQGALVVQHIAPTVARSDMFQYLYGLPIQMTVYGSVVTYYIIGTVAAGILAAFASKILLQEFDSDYTKT